MTTLTEFVQSYDPPAAAAKAKHESILEKIPDWYKTIKAIDPENMYLYLDAGCIKPKQFRRYRSHINRLHNSLSTCMRHMDRLEKLEPPYEGALKDRYKNGIAAVAFGAVAGPAVALDFVSTFTFVKAIAINLPIYMYREERGRNQGNSYLDHFCPLYAPVSRKMQKMITKVHTADYFGLPERAQQLKDVLVEISEAMQNPVKSKREPKLIAKFNGHMREYMNKANFDVQNLNALADKIIEAYNGE